jgi:hypothetical protein
MTKKTYLICGLLAGSLLAVAISVGCGGTGTDPCAAASTSATDCYAAGLMLNEKQPTKTCGWYEKGRLTASSHALGGGTYLPNDAGKIEDVQKLPKEATKNTCISVTVPAGSSQPPPTKCPVSARELKGEACTKTPGCAIATKYVARVGCRNLGEETTLPDKCQFRNAAHCKEATGTSATAGDTAQYPCEIETGDDFVKDRYECDANTGGGSSSSGGGGGP